MKTKSTFTDAGWDFDTVWQIEEPQSGQISYPYLQSNPQNPAPGLIVFESPSMTTASPTSINTTSATLGGNVTDDGGADVIERGIVYSTSATPTTTDNKVQIGSGKGSFSQNVTDLDPGTLYNARAYAINSAGTAYGGQESFTTLVEVSSINRQSPSNELTNNNSVVYELNFTGPVSGLSTSNFSLVQSRSVSGASVTGISGTGSTHQVTVNTGTGDGTLRLDVVNTGGTTPDIITLPYEGDETYIIDKTAPTITSITAQQPGPTNETNLEFDLIFSEDMTEPVAGNFEINNGSFSSISGSGNTWVLVVNPDNENDATSITVEVLENGAKDIAGNALDNSASETVDYDGVSPTVVISSNESTPTNADPIPVKIVFSESITGLVLSDITVNGGTVSNLSGSGANYTVDVSPTGDGTVTVDLAGGVAQDAAGNNNTAATQFSMDYNGTAPTVTALTGPANNVTNQANFDVTVSFSEPVENFTTAGVNVTGGSVESVTKIDPDAYTVSITPDNTDQNQNYDITIQIAGGATQDLAGNDNEASTELTVTFDTTDLTAIISSVETDPTNADNFEVTFTFAKPVFNFEQSDITITNAQLSGFTGADGDTEYTVIVAPDGDGLVKLDVPQGSAQDNAGNDNGPADTFEITSDRTSPQITSIETESGIDDPTNETEFNVLITFSEELANFDEQMLVIDNADLIEVNTADQIVYVLTISPTADGEVQVTAPQALGEDPAGNESEAAAIPFSITYFGTPTQVELKLPEDGESDLTLTPEFSWVAVNLADSYTLEISADADFDPSEVVYTASDIVEAKYLIQKELAYDERHFWRVQADNEGFPGEWSDVRTFVTVPEPPAAVVLEAPNDKQIDVVLQPEFRWEETDRAVEYQLQISTTERFDGTVINQTEINETLLVTDENLDAEQVHYWRVRGMNAGGNGEWSTVQTFTTQPAAPAQVVLMSPGDQTGSVELSAELEWEVTDRADQYRLQISMDSQFDDVISEVEDIGSTTYTIDDVLNNFETYYWQVRAENSGGFGEWSESKRFVTKAVVPELIFPAVGAESISIAPELRWESDYAEVEFEVRLGRSERLGQPEVEMTTNNLNAQLSGLDTATEYFWSVRVVAEETTSSWSDARLFTTRAPFEEQVRVTQTISFPQKSSNTIASEDYRLISIPGSEEMYVDELFTGPYSDEWRTFVDNGANDDFLEEYDEENNRLKIGGGTGLWVYNREEVAAEIDIIQVADENDVFPIELHSGWNIISNPYENPVRWSEVLEYNEIDTDLYMHGSMFSLATEMVPFEGYYFYNDSAFDMDELYIPAGELEDRRMEKPAPTNLLVTDIQPTLRFRGYLQGHENEREQIASVELAVVESETGNGQSPHPSLSSSYYGAVFVASDERSSMRSLRTDELVYDREGSEHQLLIKAPVGSRLTWETDFEGLPAHAAVLLVNPVTNRSYLIKPDDIVDIDVTEPQIDYDMYVGNEADLLEIQENLIPEEITLEDNYPNPFNHQSIIRYALIDDDEIDVRLDVFDVLGRRVQTLVNERQSSGWYTETFNGAGLASGVYLYRLIAGGEVLTGKMMLIK